MSRRKLRIPGRYERPAFMRAPLGDHWAEAQIQAAHIAGNRNRVAQQQAAASARHAQLRSHDDDPHAQLLHEVRKGLSLPQFATVESAGVLDRPAELTVRESVGVAINEQPGEGPTGRLIPVDVIKSGWNSSGSRYYPADVLERDVPKVYPKGTQVFIDHPRLSEQDDIPERSLTTLAGKFVDDPWPVREADGSVTMRTTVRVFAPWQPLIREAWDSIGISINGGGRGEHGTRDGREGTIIESLTYGRSVDFVTMPGAGGRILGLMESHRPFATPGFRAALDQVTTREAGSLGAFVESRIHLGFTELGDQLYGSGRVTRDERITLSGAIGDALAAFVRRLEKDAPQLYQRDRYADPAPSDGDTVIEEADERRTREATAQQYAEALEQAVAAAYGRAGGATWVRDYDPDQGVVWFQAYEKDDGPGHTWQQSYLTNGMTVALVGDRFKVRQRTVYEPVDITGPGGTVPTSTAITEATGAPPAATRETTTGTPPVDNDGPDAPANQKENGMGEKTADVVAREAAEARANTAELELARYRAGDAANPIIGGLLTESGLPAPAQNKIRAEYTAAALPLREADHSLDETTLRTRVAASITAEKTYLASLQESAGNGGGVRGNGPAAGAGSGMPASFGMPGTAPGQQQAQPTSFFGFTEAAGPALTDEQIREAKAADEALIDIFVGRGLTREAAEKAVADL